MKVTLVAGARPNFMKVAPIIYAIKAAKNAGKDIYSDNSWMEGIPTETKNYINFILYHKPTEYKSDEELAKLKHLYDGIYTNR